MPPSPAGQWPAPSTARPGDKEATEQEPSGAQIRRCITGLMQVTGANRRQAREQARAWQAGGRVLDDLEAYLRDTYRLDPTGVTAVRNASGPRRG